VRKIGFVTIWYLLYTNFWFIIISPGVYNDIVFLSAIILYITFNSLDTFARPFTEQMDMKEETTDKYSLMLLVTFLMTPVLSAIAYHENKLIAQYFPLWDNIVISVIGLVLLVIGGSFMVVARYHGKRFGTGMLVIEKDHELITSGAFSIVRHPIYFGGILAMLGFLLSFRVILIPVILVSFNTWLLNIRMNYEETILTGEFGEKYEEYKKRTKKIIPFIW